MQTATFDASDHATKEGWASHSLPPRHRLAAWRWCRRGHVLPQRPHLPNGHSPCCYSRCSRCGIPLKWFVVGQHRFGSFDAADPRPSTT